MNNYSALRAVIAGINSAAFDTDESMQIFKNKYATQYKLYQSFDHLLQASRARQRTQTLPGSGQQSPAVDSLTRKLQSMQRSF